MNTQEKNAESFSQKIDALAEDFYPSSCHWEVTSHCNANCAYCYIRDNATTDLSTTQALRIIDKLDAHGIISLNLSGGEPFLRDDIDEILRRLFESNIFWFVIMTNGVRVRSEHIDLMAPYAKRIGLFQISFFSHKPDVSDTYLQIPGAFATQLRVGQQLMDAGIKVAAAINVLDFNLAELADTSAFFTERGYSVEIAHEKIVLRNGKSLVDPWLTSKEFYLSYLKNLDKSCQNQLNVVGGRVDTALLDDAPCAAMKSMICVDCQGDVYPCSCLQHIKIGSILGKESLRDLLLASPAYRDFRNVTFNHFKKCRQCPEHGRCRICVGKNYLETGDILTPAPQTCTFFESIREYFRHE